jgi:hypothetical protein
MERILFILELAFSCIVFSLAFSVMLSFVLHPLIRNTRILARVCVSNFFVLLVLTITAVVSYLGQPLQGMA